jgi:hypothetical protein
MLVLLQQPVVVDLGKTAETTRITYTEVILSAFGVVGVIMVLAALAGLAAGAFIIYRKKKAEASTPTGGTDHVRLRI